MTQPTKPSAGALRAANALAGLATNTRANIHSVALIIDREMAQTELLGAAKRLVAIYRHAYEISGGTGSLPELKPLEHAIAKVEQ